MRDARDVILAPVITEKSMEATMSKKYTFKVAKNAEKIEIAKECTVCESHHFWSHRVTKGKRGSQIAVIIR